MIEAEAMLAAIASASRTLAGGLPERPAPKVAAVNEPRELAGAVELAAALERIDYTSVDSIASVNGLLAEVLAIRDAQQEEVKRQWR